MEKIRVLDSSSLKLIIEDILDIETVKDLEWLVFIIKMPWAIMVKKVVLNLTYLG
ncbi:hypothetical protein [Clostridium oryzae]|uniref:hypothetical protein n=1 Tax=Clostridium oryzae TaxID=1450648 RepID=UPI001475F036|nr:hypothetical protein [Clostridium oryzae]